MNHLTYAGFRAMRSLFAPGMPWLFLLCLMATIASLMGFIALSAWFFSGLSVLISALPFSEFLPLIGTLGSIIMAWFLFPGIMPVIINFFSDRIMGIIERNDYPALQPIQSADMWKDFAHNIRFSAMMIGLNILVLPLYLIPMLNVIIFYGLNGYLLGREFFSMAARRHLSLPQAEDLRKRHSRIITIAGILLTVLATIPLINLFAPFWGIAVMVHLYNRLQPVAQL